MKKQFFILTISALLSVLPAGMAQAAEENAADLIKSRLSPELQNVNNSGGSSSTVQQSNTLTAPNINSENGGKSTSPSFNNSESSSSRPMPPNGQTPPNMNFENGGKSAPPSFNNSESPSSRPMPPNGQTPPNMNFENGGKNAPPSFNNSEGVSNTTRVNQSDNSLNSSEN